LVEAAEARGLGAELRAEGMVLTGPLRARASLLPDLLASFPHGPVIVSGPAARRRSLNRAIPAERREERGGSVLELVLPAYGAP
ncbi:MAG: hypothetical protein AAGH15_08105, partial [Myxococcota bacterium]